MEVVGNNTSASVIVSKLELVFTIVAPLPKVISLPVTVRSPAMLRLPAEDKAIFSAAASETAVLKESLVALLVAEKSPSETASIPAHTRIASPPSPSPPLKSSAPITSSAWTSASNDLRVSLTGRLSVVPE